MGRAEFFDPVLPPYFWDKVIPEPNTGCWLWLGALNERGYGLACRWTNGHKRNRRAHHLSFNAFVGEIADGLEIDHLCRVRCCVNPQHLQAVTHAENVRRVVRPMCEHGTLTSRCRECMRRKKRVWNANRKSRARHGR